MKLCGCKLVSNFLKFKFQEFRLSGEHRRQAQEGRDLRRLSGLQQEDPPHRGAPDREHHRRRSNQQPLPAARQVLRKISSIFDKNKNFNF